MKLNTESSQKSEFFYLAQIGLNERLYLNAL